MWVGKVEGVRGDKKVIERVNLTKVYCMHVWKCHHEVPYLHN
jgi:hypothetical protein